MVHDVVSVRAAGPSLEVRGGIAMSDAKIAQILGDMQGVSKGEARMELQAIGRFRQAPALVGAPGRFLQYFACGVWRVHAFLVGLEWISMGSRLPCNRSVLTRIPDGASPAG